MTSLKVSLYAGFAIALPVILWQIWSFLAPAVRKGVEKSVFGFVAFATALFAAGITFGHQVALPAAVHFLTNYDSGIYDIQIRASSYSPRSRRRRRDAQDEARPAVPRMSERGASFEPCGRLTYVGPSSFPHLERDSTCAND